MKKKWLILILLTFLLKSAFAQDDNFKALFIYNVTNFIEWPAVDGNFVIHVLGESSVVNIFKTDVKLRDKKVTGKPIVIEKIPGVKSIGNCQILYIPQEQGAQIDTVVKIIGKKPTLIVTSTDNAITKGASINFFKKGGKLTMQISRKNIESHGLKVDSKLLYLGEEVN